MLAIKFATTVENKEKEEFLKEGLLSVLEAMSPPLSMDTVEESQIDQLRNKLRRASIDESQPGSSSRK